MQGKTWRLLLCIKSIICIIILFLLLLFELKTRATLNINNEPISIHMKYMKMFSLIAIYCCIINCIFTFLIKIPWNICPITISGSLLSWTFRHAFIFIYQCVRLQYCFAPKFRISNSSVLNNHGYPDWIYYILFSSEDKIIPTTPKL